MVYTPKIKTFGSDTALLERYFGWKKKPEQGNQALLTFVMSPPCC
jgi:hypothetical protein